MKVYFKNLSLVLIALVVVSAAGCKKGEKAEPSTESAAVTAPALTGTPAQNMITVFELGLTAVKTGDAAAAASVITKTLADYNVADIRAKAKESKDAGQGATDAEKQKFQALTKEYGELAPKLGGKNPDFLSAHKEWSKAWGLK